MNTETIERLRRFRDYWLAYGPPPEPFSHKDVADILAVLEAAHEYAIAEQAGLDSVKAKRRALLALYEPMEATNK